MVKSNIRVMWYFVSLMRVIKAHLTDIKIQSKQQIWCHKLLPWKVNITAHHTAFNHNIYDYNLKVKYRLSKSVSHECSVDNNYSILPIMFLQGRPLIKSAKRSSLSTSQASLAHISFGLGSILHLRSPLRREGRVWGRTNIC